MADGVSDFARKVKCLRGSVIILIGLWAFILLFLQGLMVIPARKPSNPSLGNPCPLR